jgi:hypothetical protein
VKLSEQEFKAVYQRILSRLTADECEVLDCMLAGAEVTHSLLYMAGAGALGVIAGWLLCALFGG